MSAGKTISPDDKDVDFEVDLSGEFVRPIWT